MANAPKDRVNSGIDSTADSAQSAVERGREAAKSATDSAGSTTERIGDKASAYLEEGKQMVSRLGHNATEAGERVQKWAHDAADSTARTVDEYSHELTDLIRRYPIQALLIGFGAGLLFSRTMRA